MRHPKPIPNTYTPPSSDDLLAMERQVKGTLQRLAAARGVRFKFVEVRKD